MSIEVLAPPLQSYLRMAQIRAFETRILDLFGLDTGTVHRWGEPVEQAKPRRRVMPKSG